MARPSTIPLVDRILNGGLADFIGDARTDGRSYERIAKMLHEEHDIDVTGETVRKWHAELTAEAAS
jgi:hypothetical protein